MAKPETLPASHPEPQAKDLEPDSAKDLPVWNCRVEGSPADEQWTVGEVFYLECEGPTAELLSDSIQFKHPKADYQLRVLNVEAQSNNSLTLKVTSYNPGGHKFEDLKIADQGEPVIQVAPFNLAVKSVVSNPQQKPFGPAAPLKLGYPSWLWISLVVVLAGTVFFSLFRLRRRAQMRRVIEELKQHNTALGPFNQFNKDIRRLGRQYIFGKTDEWEEVKKQRYVESLDEIFRMYLLREFYVPALEWRSGLLLKTISKQDRKRFGRYGETLRKTLKELDRARGDVEKLKNHDCKQLTQMTKRVSQEIWQARK